MNILAGLAIAICGAFIAVIAGTIVQTITFGGWLWLASIAVGGAMIPYGVWTAYCGGKDAQ